MPEMDWIPGGLGHFNLMVLVLTSFAGSFISVTLGLGGGILLLAVMASILPPVALIPVHGSVQIFSNLFRCLVLLRNVDWSPAFGFAVGTVVGALFGGSLAINVPSDALLVAIGVFLLWSLVARPPVWLVRWPWLAGSVSSLLTMFVGATGPFIATFLRGRHSDRLKTVSTHALLMTFQHAVKITIFGALGFAFQPWLGLIVMMVLAGGLGTWIGKRILLRLSDKVFRRALNTVLFLLSLRLIWQGTRGLIAA